MHSPLKVKREMFALIERTIKEIKMSECGKFCNKERICCFYRDRTLCKRKGISDDLLQIVPLVLRNVLHPKLIAMFKIRKKRTHEKGIIDKKRKTNVKVARTTVRKSLIEV